MIYIYIADCVFRRLRLRLNWEVMLDLKFDRRPHAFATLVVRVGLSCGKEWQIVSTG